MMTTLSFSVSQLTDYINWSYFFHAWGFAAKYAAIAGVHRCSACEQAWINSFASDDERRCAAEAARLYADALRLLSSCEGRYNARARFAVFDANASGDDILVYAPDGLVRFPCLRRQQPDADGFCLCLSDFLRPDEGGVRDRVGFFVASMDGAMEHLSPDDDYRHMLAQTLADRLAEAATELMHLQVRTKYWAYAPHENLTPQQLFLEQFDGIRPAVGYPSLPDQSVIFIIDRLLNFSGIGVSLTESGAMRPHASTCGLMFAHPCARHFAVGQIDAAQADDYARRRGLPRETVYKFLQSNIQR